MTDTDTDYDWNVTIDSSKVIYQSFDKEQIESMIGGKITESIWTMLFYTLQVQFEEYSTYLMQEIAEEALAGS